MHVKSLNDYTEFKLCQTEHINRVIWQATDTEQVSVRYPPKRHWLMETNKMTELWEERQPSVICCCRALFVYLFIYFSFMFHSYVIP